LLGDPPIHLERAEDRENLDFWVLQRDIHFAVVIQREVLARNRRALVIAGVGHVHRSSDGHPTLTNLLEGTSTCATDPASISAGVDWCDDLQTFPTRRTVVVLPARLGTSPAADRLLARWPVPSAARVAGTLLGQLPLGRVVELDGSGSLASATDELLYLGQS
jgi:hypothetical protein